jgi:hypothetical protein
VTSSPSCAWASLKVLWEAHAFLPRLSTDLCRKASWRVKGRVTSAVPSYKLWNLDMLIRNTYAYAFAVERMKSDILYLLHPFRGPPGEKLKNISKGDINT